jgi:hypothetical protein
MKPIQSLAVILGLCALSASAQTSLTTYYVVPPTNGCNGSWAFGPYSTMWADCGSAPYQWLFDPVSCVDPQGVNVPLNVVNDTIVMPLCSLPCDFQLYSADSGLCMTLICSIGPTGVNAPSANTGFVIAPDPVPHSAPLVTLGTADHGPLYVQVFDLAGREQLRTTLPDGSAALDLHTLYTGDYLLVVRDQRGQLTTQRFLIR